jgi:hypothetical protein
MVNKKKSRKTKQTSRRRLTSTAAAGTTNSVPAAADHGDTTSPRLDAEGRMQANESRRFYGLWSVLAAMAFPKLNAERASVLGTTQIPLHWYSADTSPDSGCIEQIVMDYILQEIDWLVEQVESSNNRHNQLIIQQALGGRRVLSKGEKEEIRSWKVHVKDDFFVLGFIPGQGSILVQVGRLQHRNLLPPRKIQDEYHEPRVFVVQGLDVSLATLTAPLRADFQKEHPSLLKKYPEFKDGLCVIHTTLFPYNNGITHMPIIGVPQASHYTTPQDMAAGMDKAVHAYRLAFPKDCGEGDATEDVRGVANSPGVALFRSLDPVKDASICRRGSIFSNQNIPVTSSRGRNYAAQRQQAGATSILVEVEVWQPCEDPRHPRYDAMLKRTSVGTGGENNSKPFVFEGFKNAGVVELLIDDHEPCPFHRRNGEECLPFAGCCKSEYFERSAKAQQKANFMKMVLMFNPMRQAEYEHLEALPTSKEHSTITTVPTDLRIGFQDMGVVKLKVPPHLTHIIKERMDACGNFHSSFEHKWIYWGLTPITTNQVGVMPFGDISLDPETGIFEANAMTADRLAALIADMKNICLAIPGIPILEASLEMQPSYKIKPDPVAFKKNEALLQEGLECQVRTSIDKETNVGLMVKCGFCGLSEKDGLRYLRCACKSTFYCCKVRNQLELFSPLESSV